MKPERSLVSIGVLPISAANALALASVPVAGVERDDDLDQAHHRHRREEVQPEHATRSVDGLRELGDRNR